MMPGMDGFEVASRIRQRPELTRVVMMMLSSAGQPEDAVRCRKLGIATYLVKPIKQSELLDAILTALDLSCPVEPVLTRAPASHRASRRLHILLAEDNLVNQRLAV